MRSVLASIKPTDCIQLCFFTPSRSCQLRQKYYCSLHSLSHSGLTWRTPCEMALIQRAGVWLSHSRSFWLSAFRYASAWCLFSEDGGPFRAFSPRLGGSGEEVSLWPTALRSHSLNGSY